MCQGRTKIRSNQFQLSIRAEQQQIHFLRSLFRPTRETNNERRFSTAPVRKIWQRCPHTSWHVCASSQFLRTQRHGSHMCNNLYAHLGVSREAYSGSRQSPQQVLCKSFVIVDTEKNCPRKLMLCCTSPVEAHAASRKLMPRGTHPLMLPPESAWSSMYHGQISHHIRILKGDTNAFVYNILYTETGPPVGPFQKS